MDFAAKLAQKKAQMAQTASPSTAPAPAATPNPLAGKAPALKAPTAAPAATEEKTVQIGKFKCRVWGKAADGSDLLFPPWAMPGVGVNGGIGFNQNGDPDRVSSYKAKAAGLPTPEMFDLTPVGDGTIYWEGKNGTPAEGMSGLSPLSPEYQPGQEIEVQEKTDAASPPPQPEAAQEGSEEPEAAETPSVAEAVTATPSRGRGRPKKGFTLLINCAATSGHEKPGSGRHVYNLSEVLAKLGELMASEAKVGSFYDLDAFSRRDAIAARAEQLATEVFANDIVSACGVGTGMTDLKALVDALRPLAGMVIVAEG